MGQNFAIGLWSQISCTEWPEASLLPDQKGNRDSSGDTLQNRVKSNTLKYQQEVNAENQMKKVNILSEPEKSSSVLS